MLRCSAEVLPKLPPPRQFDKGRKPKPSWTGIADLPDLLRGDSGPGTGLGLGGGL